MIITAESDQLEDYLVELEVVDYNHPLIKQKAAQLFTGPADELETVKTAYEYVRDSIAHSFDIQASTVTCRASEVLYHGHGICYAKANLLAALLRGQGIPTGFCYQYLTRGETPDTGYCIHTLTGVYLKTMDRWIRLDARGNKPGVEARFSAEQEKLAFPVREEYGEKDFFVVYRQPSARTIDALRLSSDCQMLYESLPREL
ncbi:MAG: transglutaminase-like domain-containing protein [Deltaproteobacteria bacterium]